MVVDKKNVAIELVMDILYCAVEDVILKLAKNEHRTFVDMSKSDLNDYAAIIEGLSVDEMMDNPSTKVTLDSVLSGLKTSVSEALDYIAKNER